MGYVADIVVFSIPTVAIQLPIYFGMWAIKKVVHSK